MTAVQELPYRKISLVEGSSAWRRWKGTGIHPADAPVIMREDPLEDVEELVAEKRRTMGGIISSYRMTGGHLEGEALAAYSAQVGTTVKPAFLESIAYPWMRAMVSGLSKCGHHLVEMDFGNSVYRLTERQRCAPHRYHGHLQHVLAITGLPAMDFWCYVPDAQPVQVVVPRDESYIWRMIEAEQRFYELHLKLASVNSLGDLSGGISIS